MKKINGGDTGYYSLINMGYLGKLKVGIIIEDDFIKFIFIIFYYIKYKVCFFIYFLYFNKSDFSFVVILLITFLC